MPEFSQDWFPRHVFDGALGHLKRRPGFRILEIGTFEGRGALYFFEEFLDASGTLTCVDPFVVVPGSVFPTWNAALVRARFLSNTKSYADRRTLIEEPSAAAWARFADGSFHLVFLDGDHRRAAVEVDVREGFRVVKPGGYIVIDDYLWGSWHGSDICPKEAVDAFLSRHKARLRVVYMDDRSVAAQKIF